MTLAGAGARALALPLLADLSPGRRGRRQTAWLQFCPQCLVEDEQPYFRREWRWRRRSPARATGAACSTAARPADRDWRRSTRRRCGRENDCAPSRLQSRQREGAASRRGRPTRGGKFGGPRPTRDGRELRRRRRHPRPAGDARSAASGGVDGAPMRPIAPAPCLRWPAKSIACSPPRPTGPPAESGVSKECRRRRRRPCLLCSRPMRPCASGAAAASEEIAAVRSSSS